MLIICWQTFMPKSERSVQLDGRGLVKDSWAFGRFGDYRLELAGKLDAFSSVI
jgi:hypothetical protein